MVINKVFHNVLLLQNMSYMIDDLIMMVDSFDILIEDFQIDELRKFLLDARTEHYTFLCKINLSYADHPSVVEVTDIHLPVFDSESLFDFLERRSHLFQHAPLPSDIPTTIWEICRRQRHL